MSQQHLGINISESYVEFSILTGGSEINSIKTAYKGKSDEDRKSAVRKILEDNSILNNDFENVTLAWCHPHSTLVPSSVFAESSPQDIFRLCFGDDISGGSVDFNRIHELSVVNVYAIPDWVKSLFVIKYPRIVIQHAGTHQIRETLGSNAFYPKASLVIHEEFFRLTIVKHNNLEFYSSFTYQSAEDIIYHLNFVLQQKEMLNEKGMVELAAGTMENAEIIEQILGGLGKIQHLKKMKLENRVGFLSKSQLLCV